MERRYEYRREFHRTSLPCRRRLFSTTKLRREGGLPCRKTSGKVVGDPTHAPPSPSRVGANSRIRAFGESERYYCRRDGKKFPNRNSPRDDVSANETPHYSGERQAVPERPDPIRARTTSSQDGQISHLSGRQRRSQWRSTPGLGASQRTPMTPELIRFLNIFLIDYSRNNFHVRIIPSGG